MKKSNQTSSILLLFLYLATEASAAATPSQIEKGFKAVNDPSSAPFETLLTDPTTVVSFGFLQVNSTHLDLAVIHLPSGQPLWRANPANPARLSASVSLSFNGSLVLSDDKTGVLWSTTTATGDVVILLNSSNLQIVKFDELEPVLWQSFDHPSDTIVQDQNFTSTAALHSTNQLYSMSLGSNYLALFMEFGPGVKSPMYWKHTAMEAKNQIIQGKGPIYAQVDSFGFLGLYQKENAPVDVLPFDSFNREIPGFRRLTLEADGNLKSYYWNDTVWVTDYVAISNLCDLPNPCGAYGVCRTGQSQCSCLDNRTDGCLPPESGNLCLSRENFWVLRRKGVDLTNKDLLPFQKVQSLEECEGLCEQNCSCWGAIYSNASGFCYQMDYPVQTVTGIGDENKIGYFKVGDQESENEGESGRRKVKALVAVGVVLAAAGVGFGTYRIWITRRRGRIDGKNGSMVQGLASGPYKNLKTNSFRSIELSDSFGKNEGMR
ncbi:hypothetical protein HPP92_009052 [Vanilla planifolia]|uniref:Uncharacterized protein n=1 Tax=Vanilla planifolia TaxID=51239 RepID=A0A835V525_VANPL|nr:hypothetical protein HPP92_009052 [Vanilla planifolia]